MELCPGGELYDLLNKVQRLTESEAKFYFAELVLAVEHMHSKYVLYRDLKVLLCPSHADHSRKTCSLTWMATSS